MQYDSKQITTASTVRGTRSFGLALIAVAVASVVLSGCTTTTETTTTTTHSNKEARAKIGLR